MVLVMEVVTVKRNYVPNFFLYEYVNPFANARRSYTTSFYPINDLLIVGAGLKGKCYNAIVVQISR